MARRKWDFKPHLFSSKLKGWSGFVSPEGYFYKVVNREEKEFDSNQTHAAWADHFIDHSQDLQYEYMEAKEQYNFDLTPFYFLIYEKRFLPYEYSHLLTPPDDVPMNEEMKEKIEYEYAQAYFIDQLRKLNNQVISQSCEEMLGIGKPKGFY